MHVISAIWHGVNIHEVPIRIAREGGEQLPDSGRSVIVDISRSRPNVTGDSILVMVTAQNKAVIGSLISLSARTWYKIVAPSDIVGTMTNNIWATDIAI